MKRLDTMTPEEIRAEVEKFRPENNKLARLIGEALLYQMTQEELDDDWWWIKILKKTKKIKKKKNRKGG